MPFAANNTKVGKGPSTTCCTGDRLCPWLCAADVRVTADSTKKTHPDRRQVPANHCNFILERW